MIRKILIIATLVTIPTVVPVTAQAKEYCREYTKTIHVGGRTVEGYGTACRQRDGSWEVVTLEGENKRAKAEVREVIYKDLKDHYNTRDTKVVIIDRSKPSARYVARHWPVVYYAPHSYKKAKKYYKRHHKNGYYYYR